MRNLFTPVIGFVIGSGFYLSTKVLADTQSGKMPGPKSFGYFIAAITAASVAGVAMLGKERNYYSEEGSAPIQDPMEFGEMANWTPLDGTPGLKRQRAEAIKVENVHASPNIRIIYVSTREAAEEEAERFIRHNFPEDRNYAYCIHATDRPDRWEMEYEWIPQGMDSIFRADGPGGDVDVGEKQQTRNKREDFTINSNYTSDLEVGDIDLDVGQVYDEFHDKLVDTIRESVDDNLPLESGDSDSGTMDVDFEIDMPVEITGTVDWDWDSDLNYETDNDVDEHDWNAEQTTARVRTMSGKPVSQTLRKMKHDKNITPEEARERKEIRAENFRKY